MIKVVSVDQMRRAEQALLCSKNISEEILVNRAAAKIVDEIEGRFCADINVAAFCGGGNNGCDGLSAAIKLKSKGWNVDIIDLNLTRNKLNSEYLKSAIEQNIPVIDLRQYMSIEHKHGVIIDAIFGVGLSRSLSEHCVKAIDVINASSAYVIAADIPSGLDADTGEIMGAAVEADLTVTFAAVKIGHYLRKGRNYIGDIVTADIGVPITEYTAAVLQDGDVEFNNRKTVSHKGDYGRIHIMGGSKEMPGSVVLTTKAATAALRSGAGLTSLCVADSMRAAYQSRILEATLILMPDDDGYICYDETALNRVMSRADVIAVGMGMGSNPSLSKIIKYLSTNFGGVLVLDADAINALAKDVKSVDGHKCKLILTPHMGEFERLYKALPPAANPLNNDIDRVKLAAKQLNAVIAAKSATTITTDGQEVILNITGTPAMAKGGSGDVLSGIISAFAATKAPLSAAAKACWHFGKWGEQAAKTHSEISVIASDIIAEIE